MLYRTLIEFSDARGRPRSHGGLLDPGVYASSPEDAARQALEHAPNFARSRALFVSVIPDHGTPPGGKHVDYGPAYIFKPEALSHA